MRAIVLGDGAAPVVDALEAAGVAVTAPTGPPTAATLEEAGVTAADLLVLTDASLATAIPVATDLHPEIRTVTYAQDAPPDFVRAQLDLAVDPRLVSPAGLVEGLVDDR